MNIPSRIEIPRFPGNKRIAVTTSFDDGHTFDRRIVAAFNAWGMKATFNLNSGNLRHTGKPTVEGDLKPGERAYLDASEIAELYRGHEVAIHTVTHPWLDRLDPSQIVDEVQQDRKALEDLVGYPVRGMAYPFGSFNPQICALLRGLGVVYSRTCVNAENCFPPAEPLAWASTAHQYATGPTVPERFQALLGNPRYSGVFYIWGHGFEFHDRNDWAGFERIYKPLSGHEEVWYCTNIELFDYEAARQRLVLAANRASAYNPSGIPVWVKAGDRLLAIAPGQTVSLRY
ncbi:MAG: polysaccharide deacetylase family protein [Chthoniobacteraceae bacterium]|nr:polysaccharide deacetylase family protein [Chthoniobacteraceae bacterium]